MIQNEAKDELIFSSDQPFQLQNENHIFAAIGLNKCNSEDIKNMIPNKVKQYVIDKHSLDQRTEKALYCDESLSALEPEHYSQHNELGSNRDYSGQQQQNQDNFFSQDSATYQLLDIPHQYSDFN